MPVRIIGVVLASICLTSYACDVEMYAPPPQRRAVETQTFPPKIMITMWDPAADVHIIQDISRGREQTAWRWTGQRPTVRISLAQDTALKYLLDFTLPEITLKETGPVTLSFFVNDRLLESRKYDSPGRFTFERAVPQGWLKPAADNTVAAAIDKVWVSKDDGAKLGFILARIGLTR